MSPPRSRGFIHGLIAGALAAVAGFVLFEVLIADDAGDSLSRQALAVIEESYFEPVPSERLEEDSVRGLIDTLRKRYDDRFSHYFSPDEYAAFRDATHGQFSGVGLTVNDVPRGLRVAEVLPDSPARAADIQRGDVITHVNGRSIAGESAQVSTALIKGEPGTEVELTIAMADGGRRDVTLERATVRLPVAEGRMERAGGRPVAYVAYRAFSRGAHGELKQEIERLDVRGAEGLILDLRANGGGLLNEAVLAASLFVDEGDEVVRTESRTRGTTIYDATGGALEARPLVVLVNRDTASAAEILAAAIQSYDLGVLVGEPSFGKGSFQEVIPLDAGGALDLTIGEYLTAEGESLAGEGVQPDERAVDRPRTDRDEGLDRALQVLGRELP